MTDHDPIRIPRSAIDANLVPFAYRQPSRFDDEPLRISRAEFLAHLVPWVYLGPVHG